MVRTKIERKRVRAFKCVYGIMTMRVCVCVCVFAKGSALRSALSLSVSFGWLRALHLSSL